MAAGHGSPCRWCNRIPRVSSEGDRGGPCAHSLLVRSLHAQGMVVGWARRARGGARLRGRPGRAHGACASRGGPRRKWPGGCCRAAWESRGRWRRHRRCEGLPDPIRHEPRTMGRVHPSRRRVHLQGRPVPMRMLVRPQPRDLGVQGREVEARELGARSVSWALPARLRGRVRGRRLGRILGRIRCVRCWRGWRIVGCGWVRRRRERWGRGCGRGRSGGVSLRMDLGSRACRACPASCGRRFPARAAVRSSNRRSHPDTTHTRAKRPGASTLTPSPPASRPTVSNPAPPPRRNPHGNNTIFPVNRPPWLFACASSACASGMRSLTATCMP